MMTNENEYQFKEGEIKEEDLVYVLIDYKLYRLPVLEVFTAQGHIYSVKVLIPGAYFHIQVGLKSFFLHKWQVVDEIKARTARYNQIVLDLAAGVVEGTKELASGHVDGMSVRITEKL